LFLFPLLPHVEEDKALCLVGGGQTALTQCGKNEFSIKVMWMELAQRRMELYHQSNILRGGQPSKSWDNVVALML
jgi:hypothetical protein